MIRKQSTEIEKSVLKVGIWYWLEYWWNTLWFKKSQVTFKILNVN